MKYDDTKYEKLMQQVELACRRLIILEERAAAPPDQDAGGLEARQVLSTALEELHVAYEELRHQNEELLSTRRMVEAARQRYHELFDFAPDGYLVTDLNGKIQEANRAAAVMLGVNQEFLEGKPLLVFVAERDRKAFPTRLAQIRGDAGDTQDWEIHLQPSHGAPFPAAMTIARACDTTGQLIGLRWSLRDISQIKRAEEILRRTNVELDRRVQERTADLAKTDEVLRAEEAIARLASFPELNPNPVIEVDGAGQVHYANPAALRLVPDLQDVGVEHPWLAGLPSEFTEFQRGVRTPLAREVKVGNNWYEQRLHYIQAIQRLRIYMFDITERKQAAEALLASEERLQLAQKAAAAGQWDWNILTGELRWSEEYYAVHGLAPGSLEPSYENWLRCMHADDRDGASAQVTLGIGQKKDEIRIEYRIVRPDGDIRWLNCRGQVFYDETGRPVRMVGITLDITERKQAEEERERLLQQLAAEKARWEITVESMLDPVTICDAKGCAIYMNAAYSRLISRQIQPGLGLEDHAAHYRLYHPDGSLFDSRDLPLQRAALRGEEVRNMEIIQATDTGKKVIAIWNAAPLRDAEGRIMGAVAVGHEITEQRRAEEALRRYQLLAERARDVVLFIGRDGRILEANQAAVTRYGYSREELLNLNIRDLRAPETRSLTEQQLTQAEAEGILFETVHCGKDGSQFPVEVSSCGTTLGGERVLLSIIRDITERKQAEDALRSAYDTLKKRLEGLAAELVGAEVASGPARSSQAAAEEETKRLSRLLELRVGELAALDRAGRALTASLDPEGVLHLLMSEVRALLGTEGVSVLRHDPRSDELIFIAAEGAGLERLIGQHMPAMAGIPGWAFSERQAVRVDDVRNDPRCYGGLHGMGEIAFRSILAVPLISKGTVVGVLGAVNKIGGAFSEDDLQILAAIANAAAIAIENARLYAVEQGRRRQLEAVRAVTAEITRELDLLKVLQLITRHAEELLGSGSGTIWLWDETEQALIAQTWSGRNQWIGKRRIRLGEGLAGIVAETREGQFVNDYRSWPHALPFTLDRGKITAVIAEPLLYHDRLLGVLAVDNEGTDRTFTEEDGDLLELIASHAAIAIQNAQLFEQVEAARERLENLSRRLVEVQEEERRHIARELHDEIGQALTGLKLLLGMEASVPADPGGQSHDEIQALVSDLLARVREMSLDLRPAMLDDLGLLPTLTWHFERYTARTDVQVVFKHTDLAGRRFAPAVETAVYRIVQEALTNVARHARVREVTVRLWANEECVGAQVEDRGEGFRPETAIASRATGGLIGMRERAELLGGRLTVESTPRVGTLVSAEFPSGRRGREKEMVG